MSSKLKALFGTWTWSQLGAAVSLIVRLSIPLVGVLVLDWPQMMAALLYLVEVWLFLTLRASCENYFRYRVKDRPRLSTISGFVVQVLVAGVVMAILGGLTILVVFLEFRQKEMDDFLRAGWRDPVFLISVALTLIQAGRDLVTYIPRVHHRDSAGKTADERLLAVRTVAYVGTSFVMILGHWIGYAGLVTILSLSGFMLWLEWPEASPAATVAAETQLDPPKKPERNRKKKRRR